MTAYKWFVKILFMEGICILKYYMQLITEYYEFNQWKS